MYTVNMKESLTIELFGVLKEICKSDKIQIDVELPLSASALLGIFVDKCSLDTKDIFLIRVAVNNKFVDTQSIINNKTHKIMFIPPVGGG